MVFRHIFSHWTYETFPPGAILRSKYNAFTRLMKLDETCLHLIAEIEAIHAGTLQADWARINRLAATLDTHVRSMLEQLQHINPVKYIDLMDYFPKISFYMRMALSLPDPDIAPPFVFPVSAVPDREQYAHATARALAAIMQSTGISIPPGFVISSSAYHYFIEANDLRPLINRLLATVDPAKPSETAAVAHAIREHIRSARMPAAVARAIDIAAADLMQPGRHLELFADPRNRSATLCLAHHHVHLSVTNSADLLSAWKDSLLAKYRTPAITERIRLGLADSEVPMVATVLLLPASTARGELISSLHPVCDNEIKGKKHAPGMHAPNPHTESTCPPVISIRTGERSEKTALLLGRTPPHRLLRSPLTPAITPHTAKKIAAWSLEIEELLGKPQKITWMRDTRNRIHLTGMLPADPFPAPRWQGLDQGIAFIAHRTLPAPDEPAGFRPENSRSMYDLVCFAREKAVEEMFALVNRSGRGLEGAKQFTGPPLSLQVLNLADGLFPTAAGLSTIGPNDIKSLPMWAVWFGLESRHKETENPLSSGDHAPNTPTLRGYAILSRTYLHLTATMSHHFAEIDAVCGPDAADNHIFFRFREGSPGIPGAGIAPMAKRLATQKFTLKIQGNMLEAMHSGEGETAVQKKLALLGILLEEHRTEYSQTAASVQ